MRYTSKNYMLVVLCSLTLLSGFGCQASENSKRVEKAITPPPKPTWFWNRPHERHVRVLVYNVHWDAIFAADDPDNHGWKKYNKQAEFERVLRATNPDIVCLQEINDRRDPNQLATMLDKTLPIKGGSKWHAHIGSDNVIISKYPLSMQSVDTNPPTHRRHAAALVDLPDSKYKADAYIINAHFKASGGERNIKRRQRHADAIVAWLRDAKTEGGEIDLPKNTPMFVVGDLNVYETDPHYHLTTLVFGDIIDEAEFGADTPPDWDGSQMTDLLPVHNGEGTVNWTWRDDTQDFKPGDLDHIIYSDSVIEVLHSFVLNTMTMSDEELAASGLERGDIMLDMPTGEYDHLPMVVDFRPKR
ncbi:MAG: endonuclease/exonuclease/phosphatase family protein [Phycisphaerae bacterium]